jgi:FkbM family methyltransferase
MIEVFPLGPALAKFLELKSESKSQLGQDLLAASLANFKTRGFFVEFGATDGVTLSNTHLLEKRLAWEGILAEPARMWHSALESNRSAQICKEAVWHQSGQTLLFHEDGELSTIDGFEGLKHESRTGISYKVESISLTDLLVSCQAPNYIDFLSVDTEGSEFEVLSSLDWKSFQFGLICVERNWSENRQKIWSLLENQGYRRVLEDVSAWDDWYVPSNRS